MTKIEKCNEYRDVTDRICNSNMIEIGTMGGTTTEIDSEGNVCGQRNSILYQCENCKTIKIN